MALSFEDVIDEFSTFLESRALVMKAMAIKQQVPPIPPNEWIMAELSPLLDKDDWTEKDISRMSALLFFLLVGGP